jgi:hypothetical protein
MCDERTNIQQYGAAVTPCHSIRGELNSSPLEACRASFLWERPRLEKFRTLCRVKWLVNIHRCSCAPSVALHPADFFFPCGLFRSSSFDSFFDLFSCRVDLGLPLWSRASLSIESLLLFSVWWHRNNAPEEAASGCNLQSISAERDSQFMSFPSQLT